MSTFENLINADLLGLFKKAQDKKLASKEHTHTASDITDLQTIKGEDGVGISNVQRITNNTGSGKANTIRVTFTDGTTKDFTVYNGAQGAAGTNGISITKATQTTTSSADGGSNITTFYDENNNSVGSITVKNGSKGSKGDTGENGTDGNDGQRGSQWFSGTAMSGTSTTTGAYTWSDSAYKYVGDYYLNTTYGYVYRCTTAGSGTTAKWTYQGSIRGAAGTNASITGGASTIASSNLTASRALISNTSGKVAVSSVTSTELGYLSGVTNKVVSTTTGYNTKIHVSSSTPSMSVGDLWFKIPA